MAALIEKKKRKTKKNLIKNIFKYSQAQIKHVQDAACNVQEGMPWQHIERFTDRLKSSMLKMLLAMFKQACHGSIWSSSQIWIIATDLIA